MIHSKQLEKYENALYKEKVGFNYKITDWYEDHFKKSACNQYGLGYNYYYQCASKAVGQPVEHLITKLQAKCKHAHRSFKKAVNELIKDELKSNRYKLRILTDFNKNYFYVDEEGLVQKYLDLYDTIYKDKQPYYFVSSNRATSYYNSSILQGSYDFYKLNKFIDLSKENGTTSVGLLFEGVYYYVLNNEVNYSDCRWGVELNYIDKSKTFADLKKLKISPMSKEERKLHGFLNKGENNE